MPVPGLGIVVARTDVFPVEALAARVQARHERSKESVGVRIARPLDACTDQWVRGGPLDGKPPRAVGFMFYVAGPHRCVTQRAGETFAALSHRSPVGQLPDDLLRSHVTTRTIAVMAAAATHAARKIGANQHANPHRWRTICSGVMPLTC